MRQSQGCANRDRNWGSLYKRKPYYCFFTILIRFIAIAAVFIWILPGHSGAQWLTPSPPKPSDKTEYWANAIKMTSIPCKVENGKISIPLEVVKEKKIVQFLYEGNGIKLPLLSYVTQTGKVVTAVSVCEPCRSTKFHIKEKLIICNSCYTEWNLETLKGIKGGCLKYPPDVIANKIENGQILIDEKTVIKWKPRV